jgi:hypothetical protein
VTLLTAIGENSHQAPIAKNCAFVTGFGSVVNRYCLWQDKALPFTLAHPAIVLPLRRTGLVFSALIIGSLTPDFPYYLYVSKEISWGHTPKGILLFCLPVGLAALWLFHSLVKRPLVALAPEFVRIRVGEPDLAFRFGPISQFVLIVVSLLTGSISHVLWDGFTHDHGFFVKHWAVLSMPVETYRVMPLWRALQQGCSVAGIGLVVLVTTWWWYRKPALPDPVHAEMTPRLRWFVGSVMVLLAMLVGVAVGISVYSGHQWKMSLIKGVIATISAAGTEIILFSIVWRWDRAQRSREKPRDREAERLEITTER